MVLSDVDIWHQRGTVLHKMKDFEKAAADFERFVASEPGSAIGWNYVGLCRSQLGELAVAFAAYERATTLDPAFKEAWLNLAQLHR